MVTCNSAPVDPPGQNTVLGIPETGATRAIAVDSIDEGVRALAQASGIIHVCQVATQFCGDRGLMSREVANALWAAWDLLRPVPNMLSGDDE